MFLSVHVTAIPGLAITLVVIGFNLLGDGLRDALDPGCARDGAWRSPAQNRCWHPRAGIEFASEGRVSRAVDGVTSTSTRAKPSASSAKPAAASPSPRSPSCAWSPRHRAASSAADPVRRRGPPARQPRPPARCARRGYLHDLPGADELARPVLHCRQSDDRSPRGAPRPAWQRGQGRSAAHARPGAMPHAKRVLRSTRSS